jgi:hypothetical protein
MLTNALDCRTRTERLIAEFGAALAGVCGVQLSEWGVDATRTTGHVFVRRGLRLGNIVARIYRGTRLEVTEALGAGNSGRFPDHLHERRPTFVNTMKGASVRIRTRVTNFSTLVKNPAQLPEAAVIVVAALVSSGGLDANGGIPDLDLEFGIGAQMPRSGDHIPLAPYELELAV